MSCFRNIFGNSDKTFSLILHMFFFKTSSKNSFRKSFINFFKSFPRKFPGNISAKIPPGNRSASPPEFFHELLRKFLREVLREFLNELLEEFCQEVLELFQAVHRVSSRIPSNFLQVFHQKFSENTCLKKDNSGNVTEGSFMYFNEDSSKFCFLEIFQKLAILVL